MMSPTLVPAFRPSFIPPKLPVVGGSPPPVYDNLAVRFLVPIEQDNPSIYNDTVTIAIGGVEYIYEFVDMGGEQAAGHLAVELYFTATITNIVLSLVSAIDTTIGSVGGSGLVTYTYRTNEAGFYEVLIVEVTAENHIDYVDSTISIPHEIVLS